MKRVFSFDIFDTLLTRKFATPSSLFLVLGDRAACEGLINVRPVRFRELRMHAEEEARTSVIGREASFDEIYRNLITKLDLTRTVGEALANLELAVESENLIPVPGALELVREARKFAGTVYFVSDMYLPSTFIRGELEKHGFWNVADRIYVSNEWRASKADGSLFSRILETERIRPGTISHTGDRKDADFYVPLKMGMKARHLEVCCLDRYEKILEEFSVDSTGVSSLLAGISRLVRLQTPAVTSHLATLVELTSSLIAPLMTLHVFWLLREARQRGLSRLYFVARDGFLIKKIADVLIKVFGLSIETRYLYGSRQAWHLPAITDFSASSLSWLFERTRTLTLRIILGRLQMSPEHVAETLEKAGWTEATWDLALDEDTLARIKTDLLGNADFRAHVEKLIAGKRGIAVRYLEQEGLFDPIPWAIIDLGWHGRLQHSLEKLLETRQPTRTLGLYFGLYADSPALSKLQTASYLDWDLRSPPAAKEIPALVFLMESFCTAPHGSTIGYRSEGGKIVPECRKGGHTPLIEWGLATVHDSVERFAGELEKLKISEEALVWDSRSVLVQLLGTFSRDPLPAEACAWGAFPYEDEQAGTVRERLTSGYSLTWKNVKLALTFGDHRFLPADWDVLWHGGQLHAMSAGNAVLRLALKIGRVKRSITTRLRGSLGRLTNKQANVIASE